MANNSAGHSCSGPRAYYGAIAALFFAFSFVALAFVVPVSAGAAAGIATDFEDWEAEISKWAEEFTQWAYSSGCPVDGLLATAEWDAIRNNNGSVAALTRVDAVNAFHSALSSWKSLGGGCVVACPSPDDPAAGSSDKCLWRGEYPYGVRAPASEGNAACTTGWLDPPSSSGGAYGVCGCASTTDPKDNTDRLVSCRWLSGAVPNGETVHTGHPESCITRVVAPSPKQPSASKASVCSCPSVDDPGYSETNCAYMSGFVPPNLRVAQNTMCFFSTPTAPSASTGLLVCQPTPGSNPPAPSNFFSEILSIHSSWGSGYWGFPPGSGSAAAYAAISREITHGATNDIRAEYAAAVQTPGLANQWLALLSASETQHSIQALLDNAGGPYCDDSCLQSAVSVLLVEFQDVSIVSSYCELLNNLADAIAQTMQANVAWAEGQVETSASNTVKPPKPLGHFVLDLLNVVLSSLTFVLNAPAAIAINIAQSIVADVNSDASDPYWDENAQLTQAVSVLMSAINSGVLSFKGSMASRFSAAATDPLQLRILAATLFSGGADATLPTASTVDGYLATYGTTVIQQRLVRLLFASKWDVCYAVSYGEKKDSWYLNCKASKEDDYPMSYDRWYVANKNAAWICPGGKYNSGELVDLSVYASAGASGTEQSLVVATMTGNTQGFLDDGWSQLSVQRCPKDCDSISCG